MIVDFANLDISRTWQLPQISKNDRTGKFNTIEIRNLTLNKNLSASQFQRLYSSNFGELKLKLVNIDLSASSTSAKYYNIFQKVRLDELVLENVRGNYLHSLEKYFQYSSIKHINFGKLNTTGVMNLNSMFESAEIGNIESLGIEDFDTSLVRNARWCFACNTIDSLDLSKWDTCNLTMTNGMFYEFKCKALRLDWRNMAKYADMQRMFDYAEIDYLSMRGMNLASASTNLLFMGVTIKVLDLTDTYLPTLKGDTKMMLWFNRAKIDYIITENKTLRDCRTRIFFATDKVPTIVSKLDDLPEEILTDIRRDATWLD